MNEDIVHSMAGTTDRLLKRIIGYGPVYGYDGMPNKKQLDWAERLLSEQREQFRVTLSSIGDAVIATDNEGRVTFMNQVAENLTGYTVPESVGQPIKEVFAIFSEETGEPVQIPIEKVLAEGTVVSLPNHSVLVSRGGKVFPIADSVAPIRDQLGAVCGVVMVFRDNSEQKLVEEALTKAKKEADAANNAKSQFLANVSHEIRTPLNSILGMTELVAETPLSIQQRDYIGTIQESASLLLGIINDVLDLSSIEFGQMTMERVRFSPRAVVESILKIVGFKAWETGLKLISSIDSGIPEFLSGDPVRLRQVLLNLTFNAVKFTDEGEVGLDVIVVSRETAFLKVRFKVSDTGIGLTDAHRQKIFLPFTQVDGSLSHGGIGLGLTIASALVQQMGGEIVVESVPGRGSAFWFDLIFEVSECGQDGTAMGQSAPENPLQPALVLSGKILVAEDNPVNRKIIALQLARLGYNAIFVTNGREAVEAVVNGDYALILMDLQMPVMDGFDAIRAIRKLEPQLGRHIPIVALTAHALQGYRDQCRVVGADDYITKPACMDVLARVLAMWLKPEPDDRGDIDLLTDTESPGAEVLDSRVLAQITASDEEKGFSIVIELIDFFLNDTTSKLAELRRAAASKDAIMVQEVAHSLISSCASIGAHALSVVAREMEVLGRSGNTEGVASLIARTEEEYKKVSHALGSMLWRNAS